MKKNYILLAFIAFGFITRAQIYTDTLTFEPLNLQLDTFWNGSDSSGGFEYPNYPGLIFKNTYSGYWASGFAQSTMRDTTDGTFNNLYSSASGNGANLSNTYTIVSPDNADQILNSTIVIKGEFRQINKWNGAWVNNTTFGANVIENGNQFSRKFGDTTGGFSGEDWFLLTFYDDNGDSVEFYLADYRFSDSALDYVIKDWTYVDLSSLNRVVRFKLRSTDNGQFGMNTPNYFALDDIEVEAYDLVGINELNTINISMYPNPTTDYLNISLNKAVNSTVSVLNANGQVVLSSVYATNKNFVLNVQSLKQGTYFVQVIANNKVVTKRFIKQ